MASLCAAVLASALLTSCSKPVVDENGFAIEAETAAAQAKKENKNVIVIATMEGDDQYSTQLVENVLENEKFQEEIASNYVIYKLDFSRAAYEATVYNEDSTKEEIKIAEEKAKRLQANTLFASRLNLQVTPSIFLMSPEMYFITQFDFTTGEITTYDGFKALLESQQPVIDEFNSKIAATKEGAKMDRLAAIDQLYESTDIMYRAFMSDLIDEYLALDKKDETGLVSKYLLAKADIKSSNYFMAGDFGNAVKAYVEAAKDKRLAPEERQNCYYLSSYILATSQSDDYDAMLEYLQLAIDAYPDGPNTPQIQMVKDQFEVIINSQE